MFDIHPDLRPASLLPTYYTGAEADVLGKDYWKANYGRDLKTSAADLPTGVHVASFKTKVAGDAEWTAWQTVLSDAFGKVADPTVSGKFGYAFDGWYADPECRDRFDFDNDVLRADAELYGVYRLVMRYEIPVKAQVAIDASGAVEPARVQMRSFTPVSLKVASVSCEAANSADEVMGADDVRKVAATILPDGDTWPLQLPVGKSGSMSSLAMPSAKPGAPGELGCFIGLSIPDGTAVRFWRDGWSTDFLRLVYTVEPT